MSNKKKLIPKLRFPEFKNEGEWEEKSLNKVVTDFIVPMRDKPKDLSGNVPWCRIEDFNGMYLSGSKSNQGVSLETIKEMNLKVYPINTLLVSCSADLGRCAITRKPLVTNQTFIGLVPDVKKVNTVYLYYVMTNSSKELNARSSGTTISYLSRQQFEKFEIWLPNTKEQQKIASCLSSLDDLIEAHNQKLDLLKDHKKGLMQNLFPQEGEKVPKFRFKEFENDGEWITKKLGQIGEPLMCKRVFKEQTSEDPTGGVPFYKIGTFGKEADSYISIELYEEYKNKYSFPKIGDILISASGTIGRLVVYDGAPAFFQDSNIIWLGNNEKTILNSFLFYCYLTMKWQTSDGGIISRLYNSDFKNMQVIFPINKVEQKKIASCFIALDELIKAQSEKIKQLKLHKKGLMQGLFPKMIE